MYRDDVIHQRLLYGDFKWLAERLADGHPLAVARFLAAFVYASPVFARADDPLPSTVAPLYWVGQRVGTVWEKAREQLLDGPAEDGAVSTQAVSESDKSI